ncbi:MAG: DMT family transporter [Labilithrix sp.]|nr:DMT family transporter [Labilithrix sp.]MCW5815876.1 DMT family transporter [Labilithrix sp.]
MAVSAVLFATMNFLARVATASASWTTVAAVRAAIGALVAYAAARARGRSVAAKDQRAVFWRSLFGTVSMLSTFYAISSKTMSLGNVVTLLNLSPVFLALLAPIVLREPTRPIVALAIAVALAGVVLVVRPSFVFGATTAALTSPTGPSATVTTLAACGAALSSSIAMMMLRRVGQTESPEAIAFHFSVFAAVVLTLLSLFDPKLPSLRDAVCMLLAGICAGVAQLAMTRAYALENAARVAGMSYLAVVASALLGAALLDERPGPTATIGMLLVVAGGVLVTTRPREVASRA